MHSHGDTYVVRSAPREQQGRQGSPAPGAPVDALVAGLSERISFLEATVRRLDSAVAGLEAELREARVQGSAKAAGPKTIEFRTEQSGQGSWFPGAAPKSGSALRAARSRRDPFAAIYTDADTRP